MARKKTENYAKDPAVIEQVSGEGWISYNGDSCVVLPQLPDKSIDLSVFSPPFRSLYTYSDTPRDLGNCATLEEFMEHFQFIVCELLRLTKPGRNVCVHIQDVVTTVSSNGVRGIEDFTGPVAQLFQKVGFAYCGKIAICKNPQMQAARNKVHELMFATKNRDSCALVPVMIEYIQVFKAPGQNQVPVASQIDNETWIDWAHGVWPDDGRPRLSSKAEMRRNAHPYVDEWIPAVLPFYDIRETDVLNAAVAKESLDERHACPLQLSLINRLIKLYTNPGETVLDPFAGIGSTPYEAIKLGRRAIGVELKPSYWKVGVRNIKNAQASTPSLDLFAEDAEEVTA